jgi:hypothetical protein
VKTATSQGVVGPHHANDPRADGMIGRSRGIR